MSPPERPDLRRPRGGIVALALTVALICGLALWHPWARTPPTSSASAGGTDAAASAPAPLAVPSGARVLIFGDSWTYGSAASDPTLGYAYIIARDLEWDATVDGVRGSGYLQRGLGGGTFAERIAGLDPALDPDLVIVEGSINDRRLPSTGYRAAVTAAWDALEVLYPEASIVILGPAPQVLPVEPATARIDGDLAALAAARGWWYVSPLAEDWIDIGNYASMIDTSAIGNNHPSTEGHAALAHLLEDALAAMSPSSEVIAEAPLD
ncbi:SGNH/GDSL hydrolase family protein [Microbacterium sp. P02]|uniref:SGNH/GDSL hydrolase family protein n=1 Tax=Microbacterium sp. P02 TaxID=3366260 RepID=UPI003672BAF4